MYNENCIISVFFFFFFLHCKFQSTEVVLFISTEFIVISIKFLSTLECHTMSKKNKQKEHNSHSYKMPHLRTWCYRKVTK